MTEPSNVLVSTRSTPAPVASRMDDDFRMARAIADAGAMIPSGYRGKPGAVVLVQQWARQRGLDVMTAMQTVSFVDGKPVIDATMQRALAQRAGYSVRVTEADNVSATVEVWKDGEKIGQASYNIEQAKQANLTGKKNWQQNPEDMLVARATTRAMRRCAPEVLIGVFDADEAEMSDPVVTLVEQPAVERSTEASEPPPDIVDAEVVTEPDPEPSTTVDTLKVRLRTQGIAQGDFITEIRNIAGEKEMDPPSSLAGIVGNAALLDLAVKWLDSMRAAEEPF